MSKFQVNTMIALAALALVACSQFNEQSSNGVDAAVEDSGATLHDAKSSADCDTWCGVRAPKEEAEGWCAIDGFGDDGDCVPTCEALAQAAPLGPLQRCIEEDALCFIAMDQCMLGAEQSANCATWCDYRATEHANEGFCIPVMQGLFEKVCESACSLALYEELPSDSVQECVRNNPLCFLDLERCAAP